MNGVSQGRKSKSATERLDRYRLRWNEIIYQPGEVKVVAYNENGESVAEKTIKTAGKPYKIKLEADRKTLSADGSDLSFITVSLVDKEGNLCPDAQHKLNFKVKGDGHFRAVCNGDATSLEPFVTPTMKLFNGQLVVVVQSNETPGTLCLQVSGTGLNTSYVNIETN